MNKITREMADEWLEHLRKTATPTGQTNKNTDVLLELIDSLVAEPEEPASGIESEKDIRIKYQDIVYAMCNELDGFPLGADCPSKVSLIL